MLDGERPIKPEAIKNQIPWDEATAVVVLVLMPDGKTNKLYMSSLSWNESAILSKQFDSHLSGLHGLMEEGS